MPAGEDHADARLDAHNLRPRVLQRLPLIPPLPHRLQGGIVVYLDPCLQKLTGTQCTQHLLQRACRSAPGKLTELKPQTRAMPLQCVFLLYQRCARQAQMRANLRRLRSALAHGAESTTRASTSAAPVQVLAAQLQPTTPRAKSACGAPARRAAPPRGGAPVAARVVPRPTRCDPPCKEVGFKPRICGHNRVVVAPAN